MSDVRYIATAGMFDGVHRGHHFVLSALVREANARGSSRWYLRLLSILWQLWRRTRLRRC